MLPLLIVALWPVTSFGIFLAGVALALSFLGIIPYLVLFGVKEGRKLRLSTAYHAPSLNIAPYRHSRRVKNPVVLTHRGRLNIYHFRKSNTSSLFITGASGNFSYKLLSRNFELDQVMGFCRSSINSVHTLSP